MDCLILTPHRYGIYEMAKRVGSEWEDKGHDVEYILAKGEAAKLFRFRLGAPKISIWWQQKLSDISNRNKLPDLIWAHQPIAPFLQTKNEDFWKRMIITFHTTLTKEYKLSMDGTYSRKYAPYYYIVSKLEQRFHKLLAKRSPGPRYTVVSPHLREELKPLGINHAEYIPNGIFRPESPEPGIRQSLGIPKSDTVVFNIGSLSKQKRPDLYAQVFSKVLNDLDHVHCVIAGDGAYADEVKKYTSSRFHYLGKITDQEKWRWFADADIFASLSAYEGMPVASAEALSFDTPVILSKIPSHQHLLTEYDALGRLVDPDPDQVVDAILELRGKSFTSDMPGWDRVAQSYLEVIKDS